MNNVHHFIKERWQFQDLKEYLASGINIKKNMEKGLGRSEDYRR
jgi:hypothetical protein